MAVSSISSGDCVVGIANPSPMSAALLPISRNGTSRRNRDTAKPTRATGTAHKNTWVSDAAYAPTIGAAIARGSRCKASGEFAAAGARSATSLRAD
jgi:hypothetical protein